MLYSWNTIGYQHQLKQLEKEIQGKNVAHAYLFLGPKEIGKFHVATVLGSILLCPQGHCGTCNACELVKKGRHPDQIILKDDGQTIKIDQVRELIGKTHLTTQQGKRVVLIENIERMPIEAQNAFLKTLEEPSKDSVFLLTSSNGDSVLSTIHSRVRTYEFSVIESEPLKKELEKRFPNIGKEVLGKILDFAQGRCGLAIRLIQDNNLLESYSKMQQQVDIFLSKNDLIKKFQFAEHIEKDTQHLPIFMDVFSSHLQKIVYEKLKTPKNSSGERFSLEEIHDLFESLNKTSYLIHRNVNKKLILENLFLKTEK